MIINYYVFGGEKNANIIGESMIRMYNVSFWSVLSIKYKCITGADNNNIDIHANTYTSMRFYAIDFVSKIRTSNSVKFKRLNSWYLFYEGTHTNVWHSFFWRL